MKIYIMAGSVCCSVIIAGSVFAAAGQRAEADRLLRKEKYDEALENYDKILSADPNDGNAQYNRAVALYRKGGFKEAEDAFLRVLASEKENLEVRSMYNAGNSRFRSGESMSASDPQSAINSFRGAAEYYRKAIELDPADTDAKINYELTLKKIRELEKMKQQQKPDQQKQDQQKQQQDQQKQDQQQDQQDQQQDQQKQQQDQRKQQEQQKQEQQDQQQQQQEKEQQERQEQQEQQQQQQKQEERQKEEQERQQQEEQPAEGYGAQDEGEEGEPSGWISREEAEMLLRAQEEEENRMRAEQRKARRLRRPAVLRDW
ncbi:MAG: tetratricopeptide repeat protein [Candidatus Omnitrophota bacterium]